MKTSTYPFAVLALFFSLVTSPAIDVGGLGFTEGDSWKPAEKARPMSQGGLTIEPGGEAGPLSADFYYFGKGQGGSVEANIARWKGQFEDGFSSQTEEIPLPGVEGQKATVIRITGTFLSGPPFGGPKTPIPGHAMLGAIIPGTDAPIFIKLTGIESSVSSVYDAFCALVSSANTKAQE